MNNNILDILNLAEKDLQLALAENCKNQYLCRKLLLIDYMKTATILTTDLNKSNIVDLVSTARANTIEIGIIKELCAVVHDNNTFNQTSDILSVSLSGPGGTFIEFPGSIAGGICCSTKVPMQYFIDELVECLQNNFENIELKNNDILYQNKKICGYSFFYTPQSNEKEYILTFGINLVGNEENINEYCTKKSQKQAGKLPITAEKLQAIIINHFVNIRSNLLNSIIVI